MAARLREQEERIGRRFSTLLPGRFDNSIRFAGLDKETWEALATEPIGCAHARPVDVAAADAGAQRLKMEISSGAAANQRAIMSTALINQACDTILDLADIIRDDQLRQVFCLESLGSFPREAQRLLLANIAKGNMSSGERSAIIIGLSLLRPLSLDGKIDDPEARGSRDISDHRRRR